MKITFEAQPARLLKRYKRFFADCQLGDQVVVAHVANTGSMMGLLGSDVPVLLLPATNPDRKLKFSLEAILSGQTWVGVNTSRPNQLMVKYFQETQGQPGGQWGNFSRVQPEIKINAETRLDICLHYDSGKRHYIEIKNVTLAEQGVARFPDAQTVRGQKHLQTLMDLQREGHTTEIIFLIQRNDCQTFEPASDIDPEYGRLLQEARDAGVKITPWVAAVGPTGVQLTDQILPLNL